MMSPRRRLIASMAYLLGTSAFVLVSDAHAGGGAHLYVNSEYGFSVQVPPGRPTCRAEPNTHDTGIMIFLDRGPSDCAKQNQRPYIAVNGTYNATDAPGPLEASSIVCGSSTPQPTDPNMFGDLKKKWTVMCRIQQEGDFVEYVLIRQSHPVTVGATPSVNYSIVVHVPACARGREMKDVGPILRSVRLLKPSG